MRIDCQKHYDKVAEYAKSIGDLRLFAVFIRICTSGCGRKQGDCRRAAVSWQTG